MKKKNSPLKDLKNTLKKQTKNWDIIRITKQKNVCPSKSSLRIQKIHLTLNLQYQN